MTLKLLDTSYSLLFLNPALYFPFTFLIFQPNIEPGDVIIILTQGEHKQFSRDGENLLYKHTLGLTEALCGFEFVLTHLDKRELIIKNAPGDVIQPG